MRKSDRTGHLIVLRSTVVPGTTQAVVKPILEHESGTRAGQGFSLAMQPEFLRQGNAVEDTLRPDRIIIGECDRKAGDCLEGLYKEFYKGQVIPIIRMNSVMAELVKYASNSFLAMKVSFINELANLCERLENADVVKIAEAIGLDSRIGPSVS